MKTRKPEKNLALLENFILHLTHCSDNEDEHGYKEPITLTPKIIYQAARDYIEEDHVDGKDTDEEICIDLWLEAEEANRNEDTGKALELKNKFREKYVKLTADERKYVKEYLDSVGG